jgi:hypothetical protein
MLRDITPIVNLTREKETGSVRVRHPTYMHLLPPCNNARPAGENLQAWIDLSQAGKYRLAREMPVRADIVQWGNGGETGNQ